MIFFQPVTAPRFIRQGQVTEPKSEWRCRLWWSDRLVLLKANSPGNKRNPSDKSAVHGSLSAVSTKCSVSIFVSISTRKEIMKKCKWKSENLPTPTPTPTSVKTTDSGRLRLRLRLRSPGIHINSPPQINSPRFTVLQILSFLLPGTAAELSRVASPCGCSPAACDRRCRRPRCRLNLLSPSLWRGRL